MTYVYVDVAEVVQPVLQSFIYNATVNDVYNDVIQALS